MTKTDTLLQRMDGCNQNGKINRMLNRGLPKKQLLLVAAVKIYLFHICGALRGLVPFVQFKKRKKHPWMSVNFSLACNFTKINTPPWMFFTFFKLYKWFQIAQRTTITPERMDGCNWFVKKSRATLKNGWLKLLLQKKPVLLKK